MANDFVDDELEEEPEEVDPEFYAHGGVIFSDPELDFLGDIQDLRVINLQPGTGEEALSLANLGAEVTAVDDEHSLEPVRALAAATGASLTFIDGDPNTIPQVLRSGQFDLVYSGFGQLDWLTDLEGWAQGIADALKSGGRLLVYDEHPFSYVFDAEDGRLVIGSSYFGEEGGAMTAAHLAETAEEEADPDDADEPDDLPEDTAEDEDDDDESGEGEDLTWTLGDLISALGAAGIATLALQEFETSDRFETPLDRLVDELDDAEIGLVPSAFLLLGVRLPTSAITSD